jgi:hypothetical protein
VILAWEREGKRKVFATAADYRRAKAAHLLSSGKGQTLLSDLGRVTRVEEGEVSLESALMNDLFVPLLVVRRSEEDIVSERLVLEPGLLVGVSDSSGSREREG